MRVFPWLAATSLLLSLSTSCGSAVLRTSGTDAGATGGGTACAAPLRQCGSRCVNVMTHLDHCGACNTSCVGVQLCSAGTCVDPNAAGGTAGGASAGGSSGGGATGGGATGGGATGGGATGGGATGGGATGGGATGGGATGGGTAGGGAAGGGATGGGTTGGGTAGGGATGGGTAGGGTAGGGSTGGGTAGGSGGGARLTLVYATSPNGPAQTSIPTGFTIYGRLENAPATGIQACSHALGSTDCSAPPTNWVTFPANGWTHDAPASTWRAIIAPNSFPPGQYQSFARNVATGEQATPISITLTGPAVIYSATLNGPAATTLRARQTIFGRITGSSLMTQACSEPQGSGACANLTNWATFPANGWTWDGAAWQGTIAPNTFPPGTYTSYALDVATNSRAAPTTITLTLTCAWSAIVPGPVAGPTTPCGASNEGAMAMASGYTWTCACQ